MQLIEQVASDTVKVTLTHDELGLICEALDSHEYWQLSRLRERPWLRRPGEAAAEIQQVRQLAKRTNEILHEMEVVRR